MNYHNDNFGKRCPILLNVMVAGDENVTIVKSGSIYVKHSVQVLILSIALHCNSLYFFLLSVLVVFGPNATIISSFNDINNLNRVVRIAITT